MKRLMVAVTMTMVIVIATGAWALDPSGNYDYREKGYSGEMNVSRVNAYEAKWNIKIDTLHTSSIHTCEVEGVMENMVSDGKTIEALFLPDETQGKFTVKFTSKGAVIDISDNTGFCGLNGYFGGKWVKVVPKAKSKKSKK